MRQFIMTVTALAVFEAMVVTAHAENQNANSPTASGPVTRPQFIRPVPERSRLPASPRSVRQNPGLVA
jgi:hypothetical protein